MISAPAASTPRANRLSGLFEPATVVLFAGLGGVCIGVEQAYVEGGYRDKYIDLAVNHWDTAVAVHELNHPMTQHLHCDVWEVDPNAVLPGRKIAYLHASPDCADFSKAKGGAPKRKHIRALADVVLVWAGKRRPDVITLENVEEFKQWGPLLPHGQPDPKKRGTEYRRWKSELEALGYIVEDRELRACDYGTPTTRKRLFVVARCDGKPIIWPEATHGPSDLLRTSAGEQPLSELRAQSAASPTSRAPGPHAKAGRNETTDREVDCDSRCGRARRVHGAKSERAILRHRGRAQVARQDDQRLNDQGCCTPGTSRRARKIADGLKPYHTAASCIDWRQPMLSIFATRADARDWSKAQNVGRLKQDRLGIPQRPLKPKTQKRIAGGLLKWVLNAREPFIINIANYGWDSSPSEPVTQPLSTVTAGPRGGKHAAVDVELAAYTGTFNHGGEEHRTADVREPLATVTGARDARGVVGVEFSSFTVPRHGERDGQAPRSRSIDKPLPTITGTDNGAQLVAVALNKHNTGVVGQAADEPMGTVTGIDHHSLLAVALSRNNHTDNGASAADPLRTVVATEHHGLLAAHLVKFRGDSVGTPATDPLPTVTSGAGATRNAGAAHAMGVAACYLSLMYTSNTCGGQGDPRQPAKTITSGGQHGAVCVVYLAPFYGEGSGKTGHTPANPLPTVPSKDRFGLVSLDATPHWLFTPAGLRRARQVATWARRQLGSKVDDHLLWVADPESGKRFPLLCLALAGAVHIVTDIAMRMLRPRELARAQGFPDDYVIDRTSDGRPVSKADQVKLIGNSVPPQLAKAIAAANVVRLGVLDGAREAVSA